MSDNEIVNKAIRLCEALKSTGVEFRLFGSCAIRLRCKTSTGILDRLNRHPKDIDGVVLLAGRNRLRAMLLDSGWEDDIQLMAQTDGQQMRFLHAQDRIVLDVSVDALRYCQTLDVRGRFGLDWPTLPLADLLLSKLQIHELATNDVVDILALVSAFEASELDDCSPHLSRVVSIASHSWRWYKSLTHSLSAAADAITSAQFRLNHDERSLIGSRIQMIQRTLITAPRTMSWQLRAMFGNVVPWYDQVDRNPT